MLGPQREFHWPSGRHHQWIRSCCCPHSCHFTPHPLLAYCPCIVSVVSLVPISFICILYLYIIYIYISIYCYIYALYVCI